MHSAILPISALLFSVAILFVGNGLQNVLLPVRASLERFATSYIGLIASAYSVGFLFSCWLTPRIVRRVGHIRTFAALAAVAASLILAMSLFVHPLMWIVLRVASGFCLAGLFMVIESWLNEKATNTNRGQIFSVYMIVNLVAVTLGQLLLAAGDPAGLTLFIVAGITISLALVPVSLTTSAAPAPLTGARLRLKRLYQMSPVGVVGCFFVGMANGSYGGLGPVFARELGFSISHVALFMSASLLGGALAQMPVGRLSDRLDRRWVMVGDCLGAIASGALLVLASGLVGLPALFAPTPAVLIGISALLGCFIFTMYSLCVAHTNDFITAQEFVEASSGLLLTYGIGASIGPFTAALLMQNLGVGGLFIFTAAIHLAFMSFALYRMTRRTAPAAFDRPERLALDEGRSTPAALELALRTRAANDEV